MKTCLLIIANSDKGMGLDDAQAIKDALHEAIDNGGLGTGCSWSIAIIDKKTTVDPRSAK